jgi:predicted DNA-binding transcriptional regulator AlpA
MGRKVDVDDLADAHDVAVILGLAQHTSVYLYLRRYPDMPRPVYEPEGRRARLWLKSEISAWAAQRNRRA